MGLLRRCVGKAVQKRYSDTFRLWQRAVLVQDFEARATALAIMLNTQKVKLEMLY